MTPQDQNHTSFRDCLYLLQDGVICIRSDFSGEVMSRYSGTILFAIDNSPFRVRIKGREYINDVVAVAPGVPHTLEGHDGSFCCVRITPYHPQFRRFSGMRSPGAVTFDGSLLTPYLNSLEIARSGQLSHPEAIQLVRGLAETIADQLPSLRSPDARANRMLKMLRDNPNCTLSELGASFGVSAGRLSHIFRESVGLPIQTYLRWQRMHRATQLLATGRTLTEVAHLVGYADVSHFGREIREISGGSASQLFSNEYTNIFNWRNGSAASLSSGRRIEFTTADIDNSMGSTL